MIHADLKDKIPNHQHKALEDDIRKIALGRTTDSRMQLIQEKKQECLVIVAAMKETKAGSEEELKLVIKFNALKVHIQILMSSLSKKIPQRTAPNVDGK